MYQSLQDPKRDVQGTVARGQSKGYKDPPLKNGTVEIIRSLEKIEGNRCKLNQKLLGQTYYLLSFFSFLFAFLSINYITMKKCLSWEDVKDYNYVEK